MAPQDHLLLAVAIDPLDQVALLVVANKARGLSLMVSLRMQKWNLFYQLKISTVMVSSMKTMSTPRLTGTASGKSTLTHTSCMNLHLCCAPSTLSASSPQLEKKPVWSEWPNSQARLSSPRPFSRAWRLMPSMTSLSELTVSWVLAQPSAWPQVPNSTHSRSLIVTISPTPSRTHPVVFSRTSQQMRKVLSAQLSKSSCKT